MSESGTLTLPEISSQHLAVSEAWNQAQQQQGWNDKYIGNPVYDEVIFIGSGSSYYQALTMASTFRRWLGKIAAAHPSSEIYLFPNNAASRKSKILFVGVSRSGESSEVILALKKVSKVDGWDSCGITCHEDSTMASIVDCLVSPLGKEQSTVMTKSFSSMTYMMQLAIALASKDPQYVSELRLVRDHLDQVVRQSSALVKEYVPANRFNKYIFLGMGAYFGLAQEACLKLKEMSYVWTESYGTLEFRHGPKSVVDQETFVCILLSEQARSHELKVAQEMKDFGAKVLIITAQAGDDTSFADAVLDIGCIELSDEARSVLYLPAVQYFGYYTAIQRNVDPDHPRNLTQVVKIE